MRQHRTSLIRSRRTAERRWALALWGGGIAAILISWALLARSAVPAGTLPGWCGLPVLAGWLWVADGWMRRRGGLPCLTWHSVSEDAAWLPWAAETSVRPETLDRQLSLLRQMGCTVMDTGDFIRRRRACQPVPAGTVLLHFDDGYLDNWVAAAPILRRHGMRATLFVSLEFAAPDRPAPQTLDDTARPARWDGYLSWGEIRALDQAGPGKVFDVQPHGVDHIRVPVGPRAVGRLTGENWKRHAWMQWAAMRGSKHDWYLPENPPAVPAGTVIPESEAALAAPAYAGGRRESEADYTARVRAELARCRTEFKARLGKAPELFCWPQNRTSALARRIAAEEGYLATTAGQGANRAGEDPAVISRVHVGENAAGFASARIDAWHFRATVRCFQGNHYWYLVILAAGLSKKLHKRLQQRARRTQRRRGARPA
ncbi:polysaccharide deacetylase family protein [Leisingera thetidis]|uniref:polysaccharide deacetylase family protein n=1 Tax=Leisingera thetidis TaxID=2930199 RepID=UPI0021F7185F|nr:polysaccharide deacetylase family protein [Leisingera thetidis]